MRLRIYYILTYYYISNLLFSNLNMYFVRYKGNLKQFNIAVTLPYSSQFITVCAVIFYERPRAENECWKLCFIAELVYI